MTPKANASVYSRRANTTEPQKTGLAVPSITLPPVRPDELNEALGTLGFAGGQAAAWNFTLSSGKRRLLWLTLWDWDPQGEIGDTVRVTSGSFSRSVTLASHRQRFAVPEPSSGYIEITGEKTEDGIIAVSLLSGSDPIAVPRMRMGESVRIEIDQPR